MVLEGPLVPSFVLHSLAQTFPSPCYHPLRTKGLAYYSRSWICILQCIIQLFSMSPCPHFSFLNLFAILNILFVPSTLYHLFLFFHVEKYLSVLCPLCCTY
ncbi:MAG: hypothetical protein J3R72DRAFT_434619, partial [Linnemannia gamsii]